MRFLSNIKFAVQRLRGGSSRPCAHVGEIRDVVPNSEGCGRCVARDVTWANSRACTTSGQVGCCDSSKNGHAPKHADEAGYPLARPEEPGEARTWCYADDALVRAEVA